MDAARAFLYCPAVNILFTFYKINNSLARHTTDRRVKRPANCPALISGLKRVI